MNTIDFTTHRSDFFEVSIPKAMRVTFKCGITDDCWYIDLTGTRQTVGLLGISVWDRTGSALKHLCDGYLKTLANIDEHALKSVGGYGKDSVRYNSSSLGMFANWFGGSSFNTGISGFNTDFEICSSSEEVVTKVRLLMRLTRPETTAVLETLLQSLVIKPLKDWKEGAKLTRVNNRDDQ